VKKQASTSFEDIREKLDEPLIKEKVKQRDGTGNTKLSYLPSFHVINEANRIFGYGNWDTEILTLREADRTQYDKPPRNPSDTPKAMISIAYLCSLRLTVRQGDEVTVKEDTGYGDGVAGDTAYGKGSCIELASKEAVTDATKRCLRYFGAQFGLSLYDKDGMGVIPLSEYEAAKTITPDQLGDLRDLYEPRGIDDSWVIAALKGEGCNTPLEELRQDWYEAAYKLVKEYKLAEITSVTYKADIDNLIKLMNESVNIRMLKAVFTEAWNKATKQEDKQMLIKLKDIYDENKKRVEPNE